MRVPTLILAALAWSCVPTPLQADPITLTGGGILTSVCGSCVESSFGFTAAVGDPFEFMLSFDAASPNGVPGPSGGTLYDFGAGSFTWTLGVNTVSGTSSNITGVVENDLRFIDEEAGELLLVDTLLLSTHLGGPRIGMSLGSRDFSGRWLSTETWPTDLVAALNAAPNLGFSVNDENLFGVAAGQITHLTQVPSPEPVPEPTTLLLLGTGLAGIGMRRWRLRKQSSHSMTRYVCA